jgi:quercetin dioxygenase-like cupin family protein
MRIVRANERVERQMTGPLFTAAVTSQSMPEATGEQFNGAYITFPDGVRNKLHRHSSDQVLIVVSGRGSVATEKEQFALAEGDIVVTPAGEIHWHGAVEGASMTHITITAAGSTTEQIEP